MQKEMINHAKVLMWVLVVVGIGIVLLKQGTMEMITGSTLVDTASDQEVIVQADSFNLRAVMSVVLMFGLLFAAVGALGVVRKQEANQMKKIYVEDYIKKAKEHGFDDEHIHQRLVEHGWEPEKVLHHFKD